MTAHRLSTQTDGWEVALELAQECCAKFEDKVDTIEDVERSSSKALDLLTTEVRFRLHPFANRMYSSPPAVTSIRSKYSAFLLFHRNISQLGSKPRLAISSIRNSRSYLRADDHLPSITTPWSIICIFVTLACPSMQFNWWRLLSITNLHPKMKAQP